MQQANIEYLRFLIRTRCLKSQHFIMFSLLKNMLLYL